MSDKPTVSLTPESDGFAARYDRMVERSGSWALRIVIAVLGLVVVIAAINMVGG